MGCHGTQKRKLSLRGYNMIPCTAEEREMFKKNESKFHNRIKMKLQSGEIISNNRIVGESFKITERMCSESSLKFGLCEAKNIEIECFGIEDLTGQKVEITIEKVRTENEESVCTIPFGIYTIKSCKKQGVDGRRKIVGYDELQSSTLDADMTESVNDNLQVEESFKSHSIYQIEKDMLSQFGINRKERDNEEIKWTTSTTATNSSNSDTSEYFVKRYSRYLEHKFEEEEYYMFDVPESLQTSRKQKVDTFLEKYSLTFSGSDAFWLSQLCYLRLHCTDGSEKNYVGRNDGTEYTKVKSGTILVTEKIEIRYGTESSSTLVSTLELGYEDALEQARVYKIKLSEMEKVRLQKEVSSITLRNVIASIYELQGTFGKIDRVTGLLEPVRLNKGSLYPRETLYPSDMLFPYGGNSIKRSEILDIWIDEKAAESFGKIKLYYNALDEEGKETEKIYEHVFDESAVGVYEIKGNWILENCIVTEEKITEIAEEMSQNIKGISVCGFTVKMIGLPYMETGDMIEIPNENEVKKVYILERTISGIQNLTDELSALGGE